MSLVFRKTRDIGLPSYSNNLSTLFTQEYANYSMRLECQIRKAQVRVPPFESGDLWRCRGDRDGGEEERERIDGDTGISNCGKSICALM
jgi:hypothetical protein